MKYILILLLLTNVVFIRTESETKIANEENDSVANYTSVQSRLGGLLPRILRFLKRKTKTGKKSFLRQSISEAETFPPEDISRDINDEALLPEVRSREILGVETLLPNVISQEPTTTEWAELSTSIHHVPQITIETTSQSVTEFIFEPTLIPLILPSLDFNSSLLKMATKFTEMNEVISLLSETVNLIYENATRLEEARVTHLYHNCASLIVNGDFTRALEVYNMLTDKKSSIQIIVDTTIKIQSSAIYEIVSFIFKTRSGSEDTNLALKTLYNQLMSAELMHILNTLIFYKTVSIYDFNSALDIRILLYERLVWLCENNAFTELYKYGNDDGNIHILNQLIPTIVEVTYKLYDLRNALNIYSNFSHTESKLKIISEVLKNIKDNFNSKALLILPHIQKLQNKITASNNGHHIKLLKKLMKKIPKSLSSFLSSTNCVKNGKTDEFLFVGLQRSTGKKTVVQKIFSTSAIYPAGTKKLLVWSLFNITFAEIENSIFIKNEYFDEVIYVNADGVVNSTHSAIGEDNAKWYLEKVDEEYFKLKNVKFNKYLHSLESGIGKKYRPITVIEEFEKADKWRIGSCQSMSTGIVSI